MKTTCQYCEITRPAASTYGNTRSDDKADTYPSRPPRCETRIASSCDRAGQLDAAFRQVWSKSCTHLVNEGSGSTEPFFLAAAAAAACCTRKHRMSVLMNRGKEAPKADLLVVELARGAQDGAKQIRVDEPDLRSQPPRPATRVSKHSTNQRKGSHNRVHTSSSTSTRPLAQAGMNVSSSRQSSELATTCTTTPGEDRKPPSGAERKRRSPLACSRPPPCEPQPTGRSRSGRCP